MKPKIENRNYSYNGYDVCTISATLKIYDDTETNVISSTGISASYNLTQEDFLSEINRQLNVQISEYINKLVYLDNLRLSIFPTSNSFSDAVDMIFDPIQTNIGG